MNITVIGRGNVGGGLARLWRRAGHAVTELGREGGDTADADVIVIAVPSGAISAALGSVHNVVGKAAIDVTNAHDGRNESFASLAHEVKARTGGPVAKAFNLQYAALYDRVAKERVRPSNLYASDPEARAVVEQLSRDVGYEPVPIGNLDAARALEDCGLNLFRLIRLAGLGPNFQRFTRPGDL